MNETKGKNYLSCKIVFFIIILCSFLSCGNVQTSTTRSTQKPWAYWWWHGSSVTKEGISKNLEAYSKAGIGGLHIIPIYGVEGDDRNFIEYLSPEWMDILLYTTSEAEKLGMGIDMTTGTGWPFGGPGITYEHSARKIEIRILHPSETYSVEEIIKGVNGAKLICLSALRKDGTVENITPQIQENGKIEIDTVRSYKKVYALMAIPTGQRVKRAAPGGEGLVIDYFNKDAIDFYFKRFDEAFDNSLFKSAKIRAFYNDSYEVYHANITEDFPERFKELRGYNFTDYLPVVADTFRTEIKERVLTDYCETISDLLYHEFVKNWVKKSHRLGMLTRNQAHGSPSNLLDLYGVADIPETEAYGASEIPICGLRKDPDSPEQREPPNPLIMKFASSAAHIKSRKLVAAETATWLGDHFKVALSQIKPQIDELFTAGVNHVFYHGITYNPPERPFPGRLFYASTSFGTQSHFWDELPALNKYVEECQGILQNTTPLNDILLYFPIYDEFADSSIGELTYFQVHNTKKWFHGTAFGDIAEQLWNKGFTFDYISDRQLAEARVENNSVCFQGATAYKTIIIPECKYMPEKTMESLLLLAKKGATIIFSEGLPESVPGLNSFEQRQKGLAVLKEKINPFVTVAENIPDELLNKGIQNEGLAESGLRFIRKKNEHGAVYFVSNLSDRFHKDTVKLSIESRHVELFNPLSGKRGLIPSVDVKGKTEILLHLEPGQSCFLFCYDDIPERRIKSYQFYEEIETEPFLIQSKWTVTPESGGPVLPKPIQTDTLASWVKFGEEWQTFSGKALYTAEVVLDSSFFGVPVRIDLGDVRETARITVNGKEIGLLWCIPYSAIIPSYILTKSNRIEIEVTNLSFNRVKALEKEGTQWKNYYHTPFMDIKGNPYDISDKEFVSSGLLDCVKLIPLKVKIE